MITPATAIEASPLHIHHNNLNDHHGIVVSSAASLRGGNDASASFTFIGSDGGDIIASIVGGSSSDGSGCSHHGKLQSSRKVVVQRMDGATVASFELPPHSPSSSNKSSSGPSSVTPTRAENNEHELWQGYDDPIICWASFRNKDESSGIGGDSNTASSSGRKMLCVLGNPTTLLVFDVLGDAALLATTNTSNNTNSSGANINANNVGNSNSSAGNQSPTSIMEIDDGGGPGGHTIPLPFRAQAIYPAADGEGLLIVRVPSEEDYTIHASTLLPGSASLSAAGYQDYQQQGVGGTSSSDNVVMAMGGNLRGMAPLPPPTPTGFSLPATPRGLRRHSPNITNPSPTMHNGMNDEEELSLEGPPEPVRSSRFPGGDEGFVNQEFHQGMYSHHNVAASEVPCLFSLRHPLDEIRPLAVTSGEKDDESVSNMKLFSDVMETLVYVGSPRLFHGTTTDSSANVTTPICVSYNDALKRHTVWSLSRAVRPVESLPLWKTTGRGTWRMGTVQEEEENDAATTYGPQMNDKQEESSQHDMSRDSQDNVQPLKGLFPPVDDVMSMDQSQEQGTSVMNVNVSGVPSSFSDIHPDFTMTKLFVEDVHVPPAPDTPNPGTSTFGGQDQGLKKSFQRHVFLATDMLGKGDLVLCMFMPNSKSSEGDESMQPEGENNDALSEPAILRCYSLHLPENNADADTESKDMPNQTELAIQSVSHFADLPCASAQPIQSIPIPLAPFSLAKGGSRHTSRSQMLDRDTMSTDVLVLQQKQQDDFSLDVKLDEDLNKERLKLGLYRAGAIHVADFTLPESTLDNYCSSSFPVGLTNAVGNRVDIQFNSIDENEEQYSTTVRASISLVMHTSPMTETALRAIESSLVHCSGANLTQSEVIPLEPLISGDNVRLQQFPKSWIGAILPFLIRVDCVRLFQQTASDNGSSKNKKNLTPRVEDDGWYSLTVVLLKLWGMKSKESPPPIAAAQTGKQTTKKPSAWETLLQSDFHSAFCEGEGQIFFGESDGLDDLSLDSAHKTDYSISGYDHARMFSSLSCAAKLIETDAAQENNIKLPIYSYKQLIFDSLHLLHEDSRLVNQSRGSGWTRRLGTMLLHVAEQMSPLMIDYEDHYHRHLESSRCLSNACNSYSMQLEDKRRLSKFVISPCIMTCLDSVLQLDSSGFNAGEAVYLMEGYKGLMESGLNGTCSSTWIVLRLFSILFDHGNNLSKALHDEGAGLTTQYRRDRAAIMAMLDEGIYHSIQLQDELPVGVSLPLLEAIRRCRLNPPQVDSSGECWPPAAFDLVGRNDLAEYLSRSKQGSSQSGQPNADDPSPSSEDPDNDGLVALEDYSSMIFPDDNRVREAARLLRSSRPLFLRVLRPVELSDHDYERSKQDKLLLLCRRSISLPLGRGMLTLGTHNVLSAEQLLIPNIVLAGRVPPANGTLALDMSTCPTNFRVWPEFHNGVAAGLRLPHACTNKNERTITRTWIKFNRPATTTDSSGGNNNQGQTPAPSYAHGGFLMALGLRGYLSALTTTDLTDYLTQGTITTTAGVFLGMAANKRGSCDPSVSKMLCLHVPSLLPPSFQPMDLASTVQAAAVASIGLLYQGSSHRLMTEFLLNEIGRQPMKDQNSNDREGFALVCGLALGIVNLECGTSTVSGLEDLRIEERLHRYISGVTNGSEIHGRKDGFEGTAGGGTHGENSRIYEDNSLNRDITAPGATLALGLMYIKSHNVSIASSLQLPDTHFSLDYIRPDLLALRVISRSLILWNDIEPTPEWIDSQIPSILKNSLNLMKNAAKRAMNIGNLSDANPMDDQQANAEGDNAESTDFDPQAVRQANAFIIAGACFALGLKYAGSANRAAASAIIERALWFLELRDNKDVVTLTQRPDNSTLITCLSTAAISLAMVMSGTGDLDAFRLFRALRWKCDDGTLYGTHMAFGSAIGLLFLGGGKCTLGSTPEDVAMLIASFYPHFPILSSDNQYHLQALRHLYVLAVHERILEACDVDSNEKVCIPIELSVVNSNVPVQASTPFLVANDSEFVELRLKSDRYYPIVINAKDWNTRGNLSTLFVKRKAGHLSYLQDPNGLRSLSMQTSNDRESFLKSIKLFSDDAMLTSFAKYFCFSSFDDDKRFERFCNDIAYECMKEEKSEMLPLYLKVFRLIESKGQKKIGVGNVWDAKLLRTYAQTRERLGGGSSASSYLVNREALSLLCECVDNSFQIDESMLMAQEGKWWETDSSLASFLVWSE